ncbi:MAG: 6-hydroxymethylpterin diphosphokinase MptE-like protein [Caldivirga sp.]|jgi:hypothetical protein
MRKAIVFDPLEAMMTRAIYTNALSGLGLNFNGDFYAAKVASNYCNADPGELWSLDWDTVTIYMPPYSGEPDPRGLVIAVEGFTLRRLVNDGVVPDLVVTDFDYDPDSLIGFRGIVIGHAHGDNVDAYVKYAGLMNRLIPSVQVWPVGCSVLIPGFTDGDRAVYLAAYMGSRRIVVRGFNPSTPIKRSDAVKRTKLKVAGYLIKRAARLTSIDVKTY